MKKILLFAAIFVVSAFATACSEKEAEVEIVLDSVEDEVYDITGVWANVGDPNDIFTFNADKTGSYTYSYLTETNPLDPEERFESSASFDLFLVEPLSDGSYSLSLFADSDFPIYNASFKIVEGYLKITYDWSDTEGHVKDGVVEAYKRVE